jgi:hypothetical protein
VACAIALLLGQSAAQTPPVARARAIFIATMLDPRWISVVHVNAFFKLPDATLPELDHPLVEQITALAGSGSRLPGDREFLVLKTRFLARYASAAVVKEIQRLYDTRGSQLEEGARVNLKKYLDRWR